MVNGFRFGPGGHGTGAVSALPELAHAVNDCLFFNKTMFEQAGVGLPDDTWTLDDLLTAALALTGGGRFGYKPAVGDDSNVRNLTLPWDGELINKDGTRSLIEDDAVKQVLRWNHDLFFKHKVAPTAAEIIGGLGEMSGQVAAYGDGGWGLEIDEMVKEKVMSEKLRVAIVGCGNIAEPYASTLGDYPQIELLGATDLIPERAQALVGKHGGVAYPTLADLLADDRVDVVVNLTIHDAHPAVITECLNAGKHVHSEKPLAMTYLEAKRLVDLAQAKGLRLSCSPITFMGEAQQTAWKAIREGRLGPVRVVYAEANHGRIESWHPNPEPFYKVGALFDVGVYLLTLVTTMFGPARRVTGFAALLYADRVAAATLSAEGVAAEGRPFYIDTPDWVTAAVEMANGVVVRMSTNFYVGKQGKQHGLEFHGDEGSLYLGSFLHFDTSVELAAYNGRYEAIPYVREPFKGIDWGRALAEMYDAMREGRPQRATGAQAAHVVEILCAIEASFTQGRPVDVASTFTPPAPMPWAL